MIEVAHTYRFALKEGMRGHEVWALQLNLNAASPNAETPTILVEDGAFGPKTRQAVVALQRLESQKVDGIAGLQTQRALAATFIPTAEEMSRLPKGLMYSLIEGESGWAVGAVNFTVAGGFDAGWLQRRVLDEQRTDENVTNAFSGPISIQHAAAGLRDWKGKYNKLPGAKSDQKAWEYSVLRWNWPAAADKFAAGTIHNWVYTEKWTDSSGEHSAKRTMDEPARWIKAIGVPGVQTGFQWAEHYIESKTAYVTNWNL